MTCPQRFQRGRALFALLCVALLLCLTSLGAGGARASVATAQDAVPVAIPLMVSESTPMASDCMPCCMRCYVASAPSAHGISCESAEREEPVWAWPVQTRSPTPAWFFDSGGRRLRWPVRIAFCRWLN